MAYQEIYTSVPLSGKIEQSVGDQILAPPNLVRLENFVFDKSGTINFRKSLKKITEFYGDEAVQLLTYKNQLICVGKKGIYLYDETEKQFSLSFDKENIKIELDLISQKEVDILYPSIKLIGSDILYIFYYSDNQILFKQYDLTEKKISSPETIIESNVEITGLSTGLIDGRIIYAYSTGNAIQLGEIRDSNVSTPEDPISHRYTFEGGPIVNFVIKDNSILFSQEEEKDIVLRIDNILTNESNAAVPDPEFSFRDNFSPIFSKINQDGSPSVGSNTLYDFRSWANFDLEGNSYQVIWTPEIGMFVMNNNGVILGKFNSNFVPLVFDEKMKYLESPIIFEDKIYIPVLQSGQDEFENRVIKRPLNLALLSVSLSNQNSINTGFANDQMLIGGELLTYYDGENVVEHGFFERPRINVVNNPNEFERERIDIPITTDTTSVVERKIDYTQVKNEDFLVSPPNFLSITSETPEQVSVFIVASDVPSAPTATSYDSNTGFVGLTNGWVTTFPENEDDTMSIYKSFVIVNSDGTLKAFEPPFVIVNEDDSNNNSVLNQSGWRKDKYGEIESGSPNLNTIDGEATNPLVSINGVYFNSNEGYIAISIDGDGEIGSFSIGLKGALGAIYYPHEKDENNIFYVYTNVNPFRDGENFDIVVFRTASYESNQAPLGEFDESISIDKVSYIETLIERPNTQVTTQSNFTLDLEFAELKEGLNVYGVGDVEVTETTINTEDLFNVSTEIDEQNEGFIENREYNSLSNKGSIRTPLPNSNNLIQSIDRIYLHREGISVDNTSPSVNISAQPNLRISTSVTQDQDTRKESQYSSSSGRLIHSIPQNDYFNKLSSVGFRSDYTAEEANNNFEDIVKVLKFTLRVKRSFSRYSRKF